jgi:Bacterial protein of unknown function (DUF885)
MTPLRFRIALVLLIIAPAWAQTTQPQHIPVPDLRTLLTPPSSEMDIVRQRYQMDWGNLDRFYDVSISTRRIARLKRFDIDWLAAVQHLDTARLTPAAQDDRRKLIDGIQRNDRQLDTQATSDTQVAPLMPFAPIIIKLEEARRGMEPVDSPSAAAEVTEMTDQINQIRRRVAAGEIKIDSALASHAAASVYGSQVNLKDWFNFYNGYDPLFSWWMAAPYKDADQALHDYSVFLRDRAASSPTTTQTPPVVNIAPADPPAIAEVPDLQELISFPQNEMRGVLRRYQAARGRDQGKQFYVDWLAALRRLDFNHLSRNAQVDYLQLRNLLEVEIARADLPPRPDVLPTTDPSGITGRPIGRRAILLDLQEELIPYSPEKLIDLADRDYAWCQAQMKAASRQLGYGDDWKKAVEFVKTQHVEPGQQPMLIRDLMREAVVYIRARDLVTIPEVDSETLRMIMMTPERQLINPFFTGGTLISVSYPTSTMSNEAKLESMRGNNIAFSRATVHHELIPGHNLQFFIDDRFAPTRGASLSPTPFYGEGWAVYWEIYLYNHGFPKTPADRVGFLFWRMQRCARIVFSLKFHLGEMSPGQCVDYLVDRVANERDNAAAEVRRSFNGQYPPLYQAGYLLGAYQFIQLHKELVESGLMTDRQFHDAILQQGNRPVTLVRLALSKKELSADMSLDWRFYDPN